MKFITRPLLFLLLAMISLSCSDDDSQSSNDQEITDGDFFIKATINGEEQIFNSELFMFAEMRNFPVNDLYDLYLGASIPDETNGGNVKSITVDFSLDTPIVEGSFNQPEDLPVGFFHAFLGYQDINLSENVGETLFVTDINDPVSSLQITEITENTIKGSFSGVVQNPLVNSDITITNGEFFLELSVFDE